MNRKIIPAFAISSILVVSYVLFMISGQTRGERTENSCRIADPDPDGYLKKICLYLKGNPDRVTPSKDPEKYRIRNIGRGRPGMVENGREMGPEILTVTLDCCGTGDIAFIDDTTKEVVGFSPGDL